MIRRSKYTPGAWSLISLKSQLPHRMPAERDTMPATSRTSLTLAVIIGLIPALAIGALLTTSAARANPGTLYVAPDGNCGGASPCYAGVQAAVDAAVTGDEIRVAAGTYTGVQTRAGVTQHVYISKTVTLRGGYTTANWTIPNPTINPTTLDAQGQGRVFYVTGSINPTIEGLCITGGGVYEKGGAIYVSSGNATLINNTISGNSIGEGGTGLGVLVEFGSATLTGNTISANTGPGEGTIYTYNSNVTFSRNIINANSVEGVVLTESSATLDNNVITDNGSAGLMVIGCNDVRLRHNTIARNSGRGIYVGPSGSYNSTVALTNTIIVNHSTGIELVSGNTATLNGVLWFGNTSNAGGEVVVVNAYTGAPAFSADGYHLTASSAAIDRGVSAGGIPDIDDQPRPMGVAPDLGADESVQVTSVSITGPIKGILKFPYHFTAIVRPPTATLPVFITWSPEPDSGQGTSVVTYTWATDGPKVVTLAAANPAVVTTTHTITIIAAVPSPVVVNEVLYDPAGDDTGQQIIELYNRSAGAAGLTGYDLRAGTAGYYTLPPFSLDPGAFVAIHVNASGTNSYNHLYTGPMGSNMSNSAASVVLFSSTTHSTQTMIDFVQYGAAGQTWESPAQDAGLWVVDNYVPVVAEGSSINLMPDGNDNHFAADWQTCYPSPGSSNCPMMPVVGADISGPTAGQVHTTYLFTATVAPVYAVLPITYTWQASEQSATVHTGGISDVSAFTWSVPGMKVITVTACNAGGVATDTYTITVAAISVGSVALSGPAVGLINVPYTFTATIAPSNATSPITYTWQASDQATTIHTGGTSDVAAFTWSAPGVKVITVTASNEWGTVGDTRLITTNLHQLYLPLMIRIPPPHPLAGQDTCPGELINGEWDYILQNFDRPNDNNWFAFEASAGATYRIETGDLGPRADTTLELHAINCGAIITSSDDIHWPDNLASRIIWTAPAAGRYHILIRPYDWTVYGTGTNYTLLIKRETQ